MNVYKLMADSYRQYLEKKPEEANKEYIERKIRVLDLLAECSEEDIAELYNTSAFNDITKAYCRKAMQNVGISEKQIESVMEEIKWLHDTVPAEKIK